MILNTLDEEHFVLPEEYRVSCKLIRYLPPELSAGPLKVPFLRTELEAWSEPVDANTSLSNTLIGIKVFPFLYCIQCAAGYA